MLKPIFALLLTTSVISAPCIAQDLNPDLTRMQENARTYLDRGDYQNAIMMYSQAIHLAPGDVALRRDLAYTYFISGDAKKAKEVIEPVLNSGAADEQTYQVASAVENALGNTSKAKRILNDGLKKNPNSGLLYNSKGNVLNSDKRDKEALEAYLMGIKVEPAYHMNYYNAAKLFYLQDNAVWSLLYGEIYVNLDPNAPRTSEIKKLMIDSYRKLFSPGKDEKLPAFTGSAQSRNGKSNFEAVYKQLMSQNASAISDGLNTENLIMLRTRFMMEWTNSYASSYPFTLFSYHEKMLHSGVFDAYNQWLFGAVDNSQEFTLWLKNNSKTYGEFETWIKRNPLQPAQYDPQP